MGLSVIPLKQKVPAIPWKEYQERLPTTDKLIDWFAENSRHNIGIVTGQISGVMAFDIDSHETAKKFFSNKKMPKSEMMTRSQNGRGHVFYQLPKDVVLGNRVKIKGMGALDIRAEGGQCVAASSIHPDTGRPYERVGTWNLKDVPEFSSDWIDEEISVPPVSHFNAPERRVTDGAAYIQHITATSGEGGHNATFRAVCALRDSGLRPEDALEVLKEWNLTNAFPPWDEKALNHKVESAYTQWQLGCPECGA